MNDLQVVEKSLREYQELHQNVVQANHSLTIAAVAARKEAERLQLELDKTRLEAADLRHKLSELEGEYQKVLQERDSWSGWR